MHAAQEELDPIEKTLQQFFPCRLGKYAVEAGDGESEAFEPVEDQLAVTTPEFLARFLHRYCEACSRAARGLAGPLSRSAHTWRASPERMRG